jgi:hypothetical protein
MKHLEINSANQEIISKYGHLVGKTDVRSGKEIKGLYVGVNDPILNEDIFQGVLGILPSHKFNFLDLSNIEYYAILEDKSSVKITDCYM